MRLRDTPTKNFSLPAHCATKKQLSLADYKNIHCVKKLLYIQSVVSGTAELYHPSFVTVNFSFVACSPLQLKHCTLVVGSRWDPPYDPQSPPRLPEQILSPAVWRTPD